jgi:hypothetical protein
MIGLWLSLGLAGGSLGANLSNGGFDNGLTGWQSADDRIVVCRRIHRWPLGGSRSAPFL